MAAHDHRHRRTGRSRQEHGRPDARRAARLPLRGHGRDVPRAHVARARPRPRPRRRGRARRARPRAPGDGRATTRSRSTAATSRTRSARSRSTGSSPRSRVTSRCGRSCASASARSPPRANAVMEGRDIGAVVCPDADVKVFLTADAGRAGAAPHRRAAGPRRRRARDRSAKLRDARDAAQMEAAPDAERIDTTAARRSTRSSSASSGSSPSEGRRMSRGSLRPRLLGHRQDRARRRPCTLVASLKTYGRDRVPREGGAVLAMNHLAWIDVPAIGALCPRRIVFVAKAELLDVPVGGLI